LRVKLASVLGKASNHERCGELGDCPSIPQGERVLVGLSCPSPPPFVVMLRQAQHRVRFAYRTMNDVESLGTALRYLRANGL